MTDARKISKHLKSRSGCLKCKQRHLKCDEAVPECLNCVKKGLNCSGYATPIKWSKKHEVLPGSKVYKPSERSGLQRSDGDEAVSTRSNVLGNLVPSVASNPSSASDEPIGIINSDLGSMSESLANQYDCELAQSLSTEQFAEIQLHANTTPYFQNDSCVTYFLDGSFDGNLYERIAQNETTPVGSEDFSHVFDVVPFAQQRNGHSIWTSSIPLAVSEDIPSTILHHYFSRTCQINSCFDSAKNPFRTTVIEFLHESPFIRNCILSMSAAHMSSNRPEMASMALTLQTEAISCLSNQVANFHTCSQESMILGIILLGMSSSWHNPSALGIAHLKGARSLFRSWMNEQRIAEIDSTKFDDLDRRQSFLAGALAYWEAMSSFLVDQKLDARDYLKPFCLTNPLQKVSPNPWTGISTPLFVWLADVGTLIRLKHLAAKIDTLHQQHITPGILLSSVSEHAAALESSLLSYECPLEEMIEDTEDSMTSKMDLQNVSEIYRLTALLELYRAFPSLIHRNMLGVFPNGWKESSATTQGHADELAAARSAFLLDICFSIFQVMCAISEESGSMNILLFPIICAGTGLQYQMIPKQNTSSQSSRWRSLALQIAAIRQNISTVDHWRAFVRRRIVAFGRRVGLHPIKWAAKIVEQVWSRADCEYSLNESGSPDIIYWMDVMTELRLETIFG